MLSPLELAQRALTHPRHLWFAGFVGVDMTCLNRTNAPDSARVVKDCGKQELFRRTISQSTVLSKGEYEIRAGMSQKIESERSLIT